MAAPVWRAALIARDDQGRAKRTGARRRAPARCSGGAAASASSPPRTEIWRVAPPNTGGKVESPAAALPNRSSIVAVDDRLHRVDLPMRGEDGKRLPDDGFSGQHPVLLRRRRRRRANRARPPQSPLPPRLHALPGPLACFNGSPARRKPCLQSLTFCCNAALAPDR